MTKKKGSPGGSPDDQRSSELHLDQGHLQEVLSEALHEQARHHDHDHEELSRETLDAITEETGLSRKELLNAQRRIEEREQQQRQQHQRRIRGGAAAAIAIVLLSSPVWWRIAFPTKPLDPITAALKSEKDRQEALRLRYEESYASALGYAKAAVADMPTSTLALNELGLCNEYSGNMAEAQQAYARAIAASQGSKDGCYPEYNLACMLAKTPLKADAQKHFEAAIARWPDFAPAHNALGRFFEQQGKSEQAIAAYTATVKADATYRASTRNKQAQAARIAHANELLTRSQAMSAQGKTTDALALAHKAVNQFGLNRLTQREMGLDYDGDTKVMSKLADGFMEEANKKHDEGHKHHDQAAFKEAIEHAMSAVEVEPDDFAASFLLAMLYEDLGRHADAVDAYQLALEMGGPTKDEGRAWSYMGDAYRALGQPDQAADAYQHAIATTPGYYYGYERLGLLYKSQQKLADAKKAFQDGLTQVPNDKDLKKDLAGVS